MSSFIPSHLELLLRRVPSLANARDIHITFLAGGITNLNYRVQADGQTYVLRVPGAKTEMLGITRVHEAHNQRIAASVNVAPELVAFIEPEGALLSRFVSGEKIPAEKMSAPAMMTRVCHALHRVHDGASFAGEFDSFRVIENYRALAHTHNVPEPNHLAPLFDCAQAIERASYHSSALQPRPCHNDLLNENFLDGNAQLWILDWEYAGMGDLFFDLANFAAQHHFSDQAEARFLAIYFGVYRERDHARLKLMRVMSDLREALWGVAQAGISSLDFDFAGYARDYFDRALAQTQAEQFATWLRTVE